MSGSKTEEKSLKKKKKHTEKDQHTILDVIISRISLTDRFNTFQ